MSTRREGYVEYTRIDNSVRSAPVNSKIRYYVGIESDTGDYGLRLISSPAELVRRYSTKSKPTASDPITFLHAGKLLESQACYVLRVNKDCILPGLDSSGNPIYFDKNYNKIDKLLTIDILPTSLVINPDGLWIMIDNVFYYNAEAINSEATYDNIKYYNKDTLDLDLLSQSPLTVKQIKDELEARGVLTLQMDSNNIKKFLDQVAKESESNSEQFIAYSNSSKCTFTYDISTDDVKSGDTTSNIWDDSSYQNGTRFVQYDEEIFRGVEASKSSTVTRLAFENGKAYNPKDYIEEDPKRVNWNISSLITNPADKNFNEFLFDTMKKGGYLTINGYTYAPAWENDVNSYPNGEPIRIGDSYNDSQMPIFRDFFNGVVDKMLRTGQAKPDLVYTRGKVVITVPEGYLIVPFNRDVESATNWETAPTNSRTGISSSWKSYITLKSAANSDVIDPETGDYKFKIGEIYDYEDLAKDADEVATWKGNRTIILEFDGKVEEMPAGWLNITVGKYTVPPTSGGDFEYLELTEITEYKTYSIYINPVSTSDCNQAVGLGVDLNELQGTITGLKDTTVYNISVPSLLKKAFKGDELVDFSAKGAFNELTINDLINLPSGGLVTLDKYNGVSTYDKFYIYAAKTKRMTFSWFDMVTSDDSDPFEDICNVFKNDKLFNISFNDDEANEESKVDSYYIKIKDTVFYNGDYPPSTIMAGAVPVPVSKYKLTLDKFKELLIENIYGYFDAAIYNPYGDGHYGIILKNAAEEPYPIEYSQENMEVVSELIDQTESTAKFAVIQRFASKAANSKFIVTIDDTDPDLIHFTSIYNGISYTDDISFEPDKINGYGTNVYYVKYNSLDRVFYIKELNKNGEFGNLTSTIFGDQIKPKKATVNDYINAIETLEDEEFKGSILWDGGLGVINYYKQLTTYAQKCQAMVPVSVPKGLTTADAVQTWYSSLGNTPHQFVVGGYQRDTCFGDVYLETCPGYYYCKKVGDNTNSVQNEFQPIFHKSNGRVDTSDPLDVIPSKTDRETLLDNNINWIVRNKVGNYSYFNMNFTNQVKESAFSEEQNMRISNEIAHICDDYIDNNTIGNYNVEAFRNTVQSTLDSQLRERIINNRGFNTVRGLKVVCDSTNNTDDIIANKLIVVDVYAVYGDSIRAAKVYSRTASLSEI